PEKRLDYLDQALAAFAEAIRLCKDYEGRVEEMPMILLNRSQLYITLAHLKPSNRRDYLDKAVEDAKTATRREFKDNAYYDSFLGKLGDVYEDRAWMLGELANYKNALDAFQLAREKQDLPRYQIGRCRCFVKRTKFTVPMDES